jgi:hypothetical protein
MEVCYDDETKTWTTRPLTVKTVEPTLRERLMRLLRLLIRKVKSFLKLD